MTHLLVLPTAIALLLAGSVATAQPIDVRGYLDVHPSGPVELVGDRGFSFESTLSISDNLPGVSSCNGDPIHCVPGATVNLRAAASQETGTAIDVDFEGSIVLPSLAPETVVTGSFTFTGTFRHSVPGNPMPISESLAGSGQVDVFLHSPGSPGFPGSWRIDRVLFRFDQAPIPGRWTYTDVGAASREGSSHFFDGDFFVGGSGTDIWGAADSFHFLFNTLEGDGGAAAKVVSLTNSNPFAKAGVMLRQSLDPASPQVILAVKPDGGIEFMTRAATGADTTFVAGGAATLPVWLKLARSGTSVVGSTSSDGSSWQVVGATTLDGSWRGDALGGLAVASHDSARIAQGVFEEPTVGLDWPWRHADIGAVVHPGNAELLHTGYLVTGSGADIWGSADAFHYQYQPHSGDGHIVARVDGEQDTSPFAKAGVMIRDGLDAGAANVILDVRPNGSLEFMSRSANGGETQFIAGGARGFPVWLKLERAGDTVTAFSSAEGSAWTRIGSIDVTMPYTAAFGLAVTSHDTSTTNAASAGVLYVRTEPDPPTAPPNVVIYASDVPAGGIHGVWAQTRDAASPNGIALSTPPGSAPNAAGALASPADYVDIPFNTATSTPYTLWIRVRAANSSKLSDSLWVQFSDARANGAGIYPIGTTSALLVNLATDSAAGSLQNWGWANGAYWLSQPATFTFSTTAHTLRVEPREYGVGIDQIVLSPTTYLNPSASCPGACADAPGPISNDSTIVPRPTP